MVDIPALIRLAFTHERDVSPHDSIEDKYPDTLPRALLGLFTKDGDKVFDPFLGHGTTAFVAEDMGRIPYGIEADGERFEWAAGQLSHWQNIHCHNTLDLHELKLPKMDFCVTSPPFMARHHKWNPLSGGDPEYAGYDHYLTMLTSAFSAIKTVMKRGSFIAVHVDNVTINKSFTPLVRDFSICISESLTPIADIIIDWEGRAQPSHCLVFKNSA